MEFGKLFVVTLIFFQKKLKHRNFETKLNCLSFFFLSGNCVSFLCDFEQFLVPESIFQLPRNRIVFKLTKATKYSCSEKERPGYKSTLAQRRVQMRFLIKTTFKVRINTKRQWRLLFMRKRKLLT